MTETAPQTERGIHWRSQQELRVLFDAEARRVMGMSGEDFLRRYDAGDFDRVHDDGEDIDFVELEMLIPWGR